MKNNRGFTLIEFAVSFCLVAAISILLFQIIANMKQLYIAGDIKTSLLNRQAIMTRKIYGELNNKTVTSVNKCGDTCLRFTYSDNTSSDFVVDNTEKTITFHGYTLSYGTGSTLGTFSVDNVTIGTNSLLEFQIPVKNKLADGDYGIHIIWQYNGTIVTL